MHDKMKILSKIYGVLLLLVILPVSACADKDQQTSKFHLITEQLRGAATHENSEQIIKAINDSPFLIQEFNSLSDSGKFDGFIIAKKDEVHNNKVNLYGGFIDNSKIFFTTEYLEALKKNRLFDVVYQDDILPDNTVFVLAHLAYHLKEPVDIANYHSPASFTQAKIQNEAMAFLQSWNVMLNVAEKENGGKQLSNRQISHLLLNTRYKFVFLKALRQTPNPLKFSTDGSFAINNDNIQAIYSALANSPIADLE